MKKHCFFADRNGRLTVPAAVRHHLGIGPMEEVLGAIPALPGESIDLNLEIEEATSEALEK